jgi:hypothetical protein
MKDPRAQLAGAQKEPRQEVAGSWPGGRAAVASSHVLLTGQQIAEGYQQLVHLGYFTTSDLGSNIVSELLGLFKQDAGVIGVFLRCLYQGRGDCVSELDEVGSMWTGLDARRDHRIMLSPIRSRWSARRACRFVHHLLKFFAG